MRAAGLLAAPAPKALYSGFLRPPALSLAFRPCDIRCFLQTDMQPPEIDVCLYEALAVKVVLVGVA